MNNQEQKQPYTATLKLRKWGNSIVVVIPPQIRKNLDCEMEDYVEVTKSTVIPLNMGGN